LHLRQLAHCGQPLRGRLSDEPLGLAIEAPALWTPLQQGLPDKLAGTIIISDR
jgi:hypothetical protein